MRTVSSPELADALAARLNEVLPAGFVVHAIHTELTLMHNGAEVGTSGALEIMESVDAIHHPVENLETAVRAALGAIQDWVSETTAEPWPARDGQRHPNPDARVTNTDVDMWFGDETDPVLRVRSVGWSC